MHFVGYAQFQLCVLMATKARLPLSASPNMMHFVGYAQFQLCVLMATKAYCNEGVRNYGEILFIQSIVENGWWGGCIPHIPPLEPVPTPETST